MDYFPLRTAASNDNPAVQLLHAIHQCNFTRAQHIIDSHPDTINTPCGTIQVISLHFACSLPSAQAVPFVKLHLTNGADVNFKDALNRTALHYAAQHGDTEIIQLLLDHGAIVDVQTSNEFHILYELPTRESLGRTPLHQAVERNFKDVVKLLLEHGASANTPDEHGITPILLAGAKINQNGIEAYEEIISLLIAYDADVNIHIRYTGKTALDLAVSLNSLPATKALLVAGARCARSSTSGQTILHEAARKGHYEILCFLLEYNDNSVNVPDSDGLTILHKAAFSGCRKCVNVLVKHGGDITATSDMNVSVMDVIFSHVPRPVDLLTDLLDSKITSNNSSPNDIDHKITLDFSILCPEGKNIQMAVISNILNARKSQQPIKLLQHPLIETYLCLKWHRLRIFFYLLLLLYVIFVISLSMYATFIVNNPFPSVTCMIPISKSALLLSASILFLHSFIQIFQSVFYFRYVFKEYEMWLNLICSLVTIILVLSVRDHTKENEHKMKITLTSSEPPSWELHILSVIILFAWIELMLLIGRHPTYGYFVLMFTVVLQNVLKVLVTFMCLVIGFAFSFFILFRSRGQFKNPCEALIKTIIMMMGEFEFDEIIDKDKASKTIPFQSHQKFENPLQALFQKAIMMMGEFKSENIEDKASKAAYLPVTSSIIVVMFVVVCNIVLINLLVGLAVSDIQSIRSEGHAKRLAKQAKFLSHLERILSTTLLRSYWIPHRIYQLLYVNRCVNPTLTIRPGLITLKKCVDNKEVSWIPPSVLQSIITVAMKNFSSSKTSDESDDIQFIKDKLTAFEIQLEKYLLQKSFKTSQQHT